jgi:hypothetical protein
MPIFYPFLTVLNHLVISSFFASNNLINWAFFKMTGLIDIVPFMTLLEFLRSNLTVNLLYLAKLSDNLQLS